MSSKPRENIKAELQCVEACVSAIDELHRHYTREGDETDSVAEANACAARARTIVWLLHYYRVELANGK